MSTIRVWRRVWAGALVGALGLAQTVEAEAAFDPIAHVRAALARGETDIRVPKGRYVLDLPKDRSVYLSLRSVRDVTIDFQGSELIGKVRTRMISLMTCTNVTIRNVSIDYETLPFTQAVIEKVDAEKNWDVRVIPGYPCPTDAGGTGGEGNTWPLQAYDKDTLELKNPMRFRDNVLITQTGADTYRITGGVDRRGDVGDIAVWSIREVSRPVTWAATWTDFGTDIRFENVTVYSTPHGVGFMDTFGRRTTWVNCVLDRRPPETDWVRRGLRRLRSGNHDAFNSRGSPVGPRILGCTARYHCDDCVNICGNYAVVMSQAGRRLRLAASGMAAHLDAGDTAQLMTYDGRCLNDVRIVSSVRLRQPPTAAERDFLGRQNFWPGVAKNCNVTMEVEIDGDVELPQGSIIVSNEYAGRGYVVRGNTFGRARARGLILQASDGVVEDNLIEVPFDDGVKISMSYIWLEACCGKNITLRNNRIVGKGCGRGIMIGGTPGAKGATLQADSHRDIRLVDNRVEGMRAGLWVCGCTNLTLTGNVFAGCVSTQALANVAGLHARDVRPRAKLAVEPYYASHMVLQRQRTNPIRGTATPGACVTVAYRDIRAFAVAGQDGAWQTVLPVRKACREGSDLVVTADGERIVFSDVLVGDIWLCAGQSNMELCFGAKILGYAEAAQASVNFPNVRELKFDKIRSKIPVAELKARPWSVCVGARALGPVSGVGYFFARALNRETTMPIGIWDNNWGGCAIGHYLPGGEQDNGMIRPVAHRPIAGILWYQGESDWPKRNYGELLTRLAHHWRGLWGADTPFYIVQLSSWSGNNVMTPNFKPWWKPSGKVAGGDGFALCRELQRQVAAALPKSGLVVTFDVGDEGDCHPKNKLDVGERAALWALRDVYRFKKAVVSGPVLRQVRREGRALRLTFDSVGSGLMAAAKDPTACGAMPVEERTLKGFALAGTNGVYAVAEARIYGASVVVSATAVDEPFAVRYAYEAMPMGRANLYNREGLPASPFAADVESNRVR